MTRSFLFAREDIVQEETRALQQELAKLQDQVANLELSLEVKPHYGRGEGDPAITRWELNRALLEQLRERVKSVEQALSRSYRGTYGICAQCGQEIHPDRLAVLLDTKLCIRCARADERVPAR
jgi:DnaK suppressor protein